MTDATTAPSPRMQRSITTPEGVMLHVTLAGRGERFTAVIIDLAIIGAILTAIVAVVIAVWSDIGGNWAMSLAIVLSFGVRSFYFMFFELRWQGTTPGKRLLELRVIDRAGGQLRPNAIFARNLMREVELFIPLSLILGGASMMENLFSLLWIGVLVALPFFNRDRLRGGDIIAGTWVVETPKAELLPDIAETQPKNELNAVVQFTPEQLSIYGIYELQTLEQVMRQDGENSAATKSTVALTIQGKIGWQPPDEQPVDPSAFLQAFYAAQRGNLERNVLFGKRRENKFDKN